MFLEIGSKISPFISTNLLAYNTKVINYNENNYFYFNNIIPNINSVVSVDGTSFYPTTLSQNIPIGTFLLDSDVEVFPYVTTGLFYNSSFGSSFIITIDKPTNSEDFLSYELYWSLDDITYTLLAEQFGTDNNIFTMNGLTDGLTYYFKARYKDYIGNVSEYGSTVSKSIEMRPIAPTMTVEAVYDPDHPEIQGKLSIDVEPPDGQHTDCQGYYLYCNYNPLLGLTEEIDYNYILAKFDETGGTLELTASYLFTGTWKFAAVAIDNNGLRSIPALYENYINIDDWTEVSLPPIITNMEAKLIPNGKVEITTTINDPLLLTENVSKVVFLINETTEEEVFTSQSFTILHNSEEFADETELVIYAYIDNSGLVSPTYGPITIIVDNAAPEGTSNLTVEVIR